MLRVSVVGDSSAQGKQGVSGDQIFDGKRPPFVELAQVFVAEL